MSMLETVKTAITSQAAEKAFLLGKHSPKILFGVGVIGFGATVYLACKSTLKLPKILSDHEHELDDLAEARGTETIGDDEYNKLVRKEKLYTAGKILKLYAIPVGIGALSIGALTGSHIVLNKQNAGLLATVKALETGYKQYRERVVADQGAEKDWEYAHGAEKVEVEETLANGKKKVTTKTVVMDKNGLSPYATVWGKGTSKAWSRIPLENPMILQARQAWCNDKLKSQGYLFLNQAREILGMEDVPEGQFVGWLYNHEDAGDEYVTLGIFESNLNSDAQAFIDGYHNEVMIDFNVDGEIWSKIGKKNPKLPL